MNEEEKKLKSYVKTRCPERREMCICGIELTALKTKEEIQYICDMRNHISDVRAFYHQKIMEY